MENNQMAETGRPYIGMMVKFMKSGERESAAVVNGVWTDTEIDVAVLSPGVSAVAAYQHVKKGDIDSGLPHWWENVVPR